MGAWKPQQVTLLTPRAALAFSHGAWALLCPRPRHWARVVEPMPASLPPALPATAQLRAHPSLVAGTSAPGSGEPASTPALEGSLSPAAAPPPRAAKGREGLSRNPRPERITFELGVWRPPPRAARTGDEVTHSRGWRASSPSK